MKVGDRIVASVVNGTPDGLKIEGEVGPLLGAATLLVHRLARSVDT